MRKHLAVLLRKDLLTLKRNWIFSLLFVLLPVFMMVAFWKFELLFDTQIQGEKFNTEHSRYTKKNFIWSEFLMSNMSHQHRREEFKNASLLVGCRKAGRTDIGIIVPPAFRTGLLPIIEREMNERALRVHSFESQKAMFDEVSSNYNTDFCFGFEVTDVRPGIKEVNVTIMFPRELAQDTQKPLYDLTQRNPDLLNWNYTFHYGAPHFMVHMTDILILLMTGHRTYDIELAFIPMKTPEFTELPPFAAQQLSIAFPFFYICIYLLPLYYMVTKLAEERESRAREGMKMMGLKDRTYFAGWFIFFGLINILIATLIVAVLSIEVFANSNMWLLWLMSLEYGMTLYGFSFMLVAFLPNKKASATAATVTHLLSYYLAVLYKGHKYTYFQKALIACLVPNCGMSMMLDHLLHCEIEGGTGLTVRNAALSFEHFDFFTGLYCMAVCVVFWACIGLYLDQVVPRELGLAKPWNFLCKCKKTKAFREVVEEERYRADLEKTKNFERATGALSQTPALKIRGLKKVYPDGKLAVDNVSMTMYEGQIFALLGHNGAGKTTVIGMLTGLLNPTSGTGSVMGFDIFEDQESLRENLGVCPQHNVLFEYLTVREHLELYATFKGVPYHQIKKRVDTMIFELELDLIQNQLASTLSGGQKRKTSTGIALIGDSKVIMLDEPTSGMDTTTRCKFWQMLKNYKQGRIIILTTHYMDEADNLGDRVCIMAEGEVQTCGSTLYLKNRFGVGYNLIISKTASSDTAAIEKFIKKSLPEAIMMQELSTEVHYQIPEKACAKFKDFFNILDSNLVKLNIGSYGVTVTTLEQIFLKIGHGVGHDSTETKIQKSSANMSSLSDRQRTLAEYSIADDNADASSLNSVMQLRALIRKKVLVQVRDFRSCIMDLILPCLMIFIGVWASQLDMLPKEFPARALSLYNFPGGNPLIRNDRNFNQTDEDISEFLDFGFRGDVGKGKLWTEEIVVPVNHTTDFFDQVKQVDQVIFDSRNEKGPFWGEFFVQQAHRDDHLYAIAAYVNASQPAAPLTMAAYALQAVVRSEIEDPEFRLNFFERPCPFNLRWSAAITTVLGVFSSLSFTIAYMMVSDSIVQSLINERMKQTKHQIMLSGGNRLIYWLSHYIVDVLTHMIPAVVTVFSVNYFNQNVPQVEYLFALFCFVNPFFLYFVSFFFENDAKASIFVRILYFAVGGIAPIAMQILNIINRQTIEWGLYFKPYFYYFPIYNLAIGYIGIQNRDLIEKVHHREGEFTTWDWLIAGESVWRLLLELGFYYMAVMFFEYRIYDKYLRLVHSYAKMAFGKLYQTISRKKSRVLYRMKTDFEFVDTEDQIELINDSDPLKEQQRVKTVTDCAVKVENLDKSYTYGELAVDNLSFALNYGECFALLGVTGAGKTSTFKCLTGEEWADNGKLSLGGFDLLEQSESDKARMMIGYCPQFDAIFEGITVREHLEIYSAIKGIRKDYTEEIIEMTLHEMDLFQYSDVRAGNLSGGNKRKLQCCLALLGNPPIILLDEPSTGVDPQAKRFMWTLISNISVKRKKSCVILTTHSMEEAEALSTKMGIMVKGQFQCFGSATHIKDKYAQGFSIAINFAPLSADEVAKQAKSLKYEVTDVLDKDGITKLLQKMNILMDIHTEQGSGTFQQVVQQIHTKAVSTKFFEKLQSVFGTVTVVDSLANSWNYKVSKNGHSIGYVFGMMEEIKSKFSVSEYSASQTTLEQIFNMFANQSKFMGKDKDKKQKTD